MKDMISQLKGKQTAEIKPPAENDGDEYCPTSVDPAAVMAEANKNAKKPDPASDGGV